MSHLPWLTLIRWLGARLGKVNAGRQIRQAECSTYKCGRPPLLVQPQAGQLPTTASAVKHNSPLVSFRTAKHLRSNLIMASSSRVSWRRPLNLEHPGLDFNLHGFCNRLSYDIVVFWAITSFWHSLPLAVCGLVWPHSPAALTVTQWVQAASLAIWFGMITLACDYRQMLDFGNSMFDHQKYGRWIHPSIPIGLISSNNLITCWLVRFQQVVILRTEIFPLGRFQFRGRALLVFGWGSLVVLIVLYTVPYRSIDPRNWPGRILNRLARRFILWPLLRRRKKRRDALSATCLGPGCPDGVPFTYSPLQSRTSIRLLEMTVDSRTRTAISANLVGFDISNAPPFEAISYRWGDPAKTHHIQLGCRLPRPLRITQSAYDALCAVTPLCGTKYVWIDSICINQEVASEKSQQIPLMGAIYESASLVTAYIPDPGYAMKVNVHITGLAWSEVLLGASDDKPAFPRWAEFVQQATSPEGLVMYVGHDREWQLLPDLVYNPIWERAWIVQETILAKKWRLLYGDTSMTGGTLHTATTVYLRWEAVKDLLHHQKNRSRFIEKPTATFSPLFYYRLLRLRMDSGEQPSLIKNVVNFLGSKATVPEDKVYALLSISSGPACVSLQQNLQQDGLMAERQLYTDLVRQALEADSFLTFCISGTNQYPRKTGLPSWVPDLSSASINLATSHYHSHHPFSAGSAWKAEYGFSLDGNELRIRGVILDDVHTFGSPIFEPPEPGTLGDNNAADAAMDAKDPTDPKNMLPIWRTLSAAAQFAQQLIPDAYYMGRMEPSEALCRTLLQDFTMSQQDLDDEPGRVADVMRVLAKLASLSSETLEDVQAVSKSMEGLDMSCFSGILTSLMFRQLAITRKGYLASVPWGTREGDAVCIFQGAPAPCVLRPVEGGEPNCYVFHGEAYVQGWMHGEARDLELEKVWFTLR